MEIIVLKGREKSGKTTTTALIHNLLLEKGFECKKMNYDSSVNSEIQKIEIENEVKDFSSEFEFENKKIHIFSEGDRKKYFNEHILPYSKKCNEVDVLVICVRIDFKDKRWKYLLEDVVKEVFKDCNRKEFSPKYLNEYNDKNEMIAAKKETAAKIVDYIYEVIQ